MQQPVLTVLHVMADAGPFSATLIYLDLLILEVSVHLLLDLPVSGFDGFLPICSDFQPILHTTATCSG